MMKKNNFLVFLLLVGIQAFPQKINIYDAVKAGKELSKMYKKNTALEKYWFSTAELEFILPSKTRYSTSFFDKDVNAYTGFDTEINNKPVYGVLYTINYPIFNKLSMGAVAGFLRHGQSKVTNLKIGGIVRYHFVDYTNVNIYMMIASMVSLNNDAKSIFGNFRLGLHFPFIKNEGYNVTLNGFWENTSFNIKGKLLRKDEQNNSNYLLLRSYGIALGVQF